ncbi:MAG TPA: phosphate acetyltransferase, partial [Anaeromyxobacteraceae bacterium]
MARILLVAPAGRQVGLTTACLGLARALDRQGLRVAFAKPLAGRGEDRSVPLMRLGAQLAPPPPLDRDEVERLLAAGDDQTLLERVVALCQAAGRGADVLVVEGLAPEPGMVWSSRVNALVAKALDAELILVASAAGHEPAPGAVRGSAQELAQAVAIAARGYGAAAEGRPVACLLNRAGDAGVPDGPALALHRAALEAEGLRLLGAVPTSPELAAPRVLDLVAGVGAAVLWPGELARRRIRAVRLCAMTVANVIKVFEPGVLVVTPGDRSDVLVSAALAVQSGVPLAGVLLTGGVAPDPKVLELCEGALQRGLPILTLEADSFTAARAVAEMNREIPIDDAERVELAMNAVADRIDGSWLAGLALPGRPARLSPPAFRHRLVEAARAAQKRIVLPEGAEPRTVAAAAIVAARGIARCVLLGRPDEVREVARKQGVVLPPSVELVDAAAVAPRYVDALVARRKAKGMTPELARSELADEIMVGTMMMALDEADGLVSGAIHTTAHTIRPALQLVKTAPGCDLVS